MSISLNCEGQTKEGLLGYTSQAASGAQLFRCIKEGTHFTASDQQECIDRGYTVEGGLGYQP